MTWPVFRQKSDDDLWAIVAYLRSIKAVTNAVPANQGPAKNADGSADWSGIYKNLPPPFLPYPGRNEAP